MRYGTLVINGVRVPVESVRFEGGASILSGRVRLERDVRWSGGEELVLLGVDGVQVCRQPGGHVPVRGRAGDVMVFDWRVVWKDVIPVRRGPEPPRRRWRWRVSAA